MRSSQVSGPVILLDACVLAPPTLREVLFRCAAEGLFQPRWSDRIEAEWRAAARKRDPDLPDPLLDADRAQARARFPAALVEGWEALEGPLSLPDWNDRHVLAAAIAAKAEILLTDNLRDFPKRILAGHGIEREAADPFLWRLAGDAPDHIATALASFSEISGISFDALPAHLKRCRLPRFAKAARPLLEARA